MCKNIAKSITATEAKPNNLTKITNIDGRVPHRWPRSRSEHNSGSSGQKGCKLDSFQDPHFKTLIPKWAKRMQNEFISTPFPEILLSTQLICLVCIHMESISSHFKTLHMNRAPNNVRKLSHFRSQISQNRLNWENSWQRPHKRT